MDLPEPTPAFIARSLAALGVHEAPLRTLPRDDRIAAFLPGDRLAWFPLNEDGRASMACEARVLRLIERHCSYAAPRMLHEDTAGWQLRSMVPGVVDPGRALERLADDAALAARIGGQLGLILAQQHSVPPGELRGWLPDTPDWPRRQDRANLPQVVTDPTLLARIDRALARHADILGEPPVLAHCDLGFHNLALDPVTHDIAGVFDYDGAAFSDRHQDFKLLVLHRPDDREPLLDATIAAYEPLADARIDRARVHLLNACESIGFLGFRFGHPPEESWCGRTLAQDLAWADRALASAGF